MLAAQTEEPDQEWLCGWAHDIGQRMAGESRRRQKGSACTMSDQGRHTFTAGQLARIVHIAADDQRFVGQLVTVGTMGVFSEPDDVFVTTDDGESMFVKAHQLAPLAGD